MPYEKIRYRVTDGVGLITLDDPPANTYSYDMMRELDDAVLDCQDGSRRPRAGADRRG